MERSTIVGRGTTGRLSRLDGLRGVLATVVVLDHVTHHVVPVSTVRDVADIGARLAVYGFFVISGIVLAGGVERHGYGLFVLRRWARLWPVCAVSLLLAMALGSSPYVRTTPALQEFLLLSDGYPDNGPLWTLAIEIRAAFLWPVLVWCARGSALRLAFGFAAGMAPLFLPGDDIPWVSSLALGWPWFLIGIVLARRGLVPALPRWLDGKAYAALGAVSFSLYAVHGVMIDAVSGPEVWGVGRGALAALLVTVATIVTWGAIERPSMRLAQRLRRMPRRELALEG